MDAADQRLESQRLRATLLMAAVGGLFALALLVRWRLGKGGAAGGGE